MGVAMAAGLFVALLMGVLLVRGDSRPLQRAATVAAVAAGDLTQQIDAQPG
jgi:methyl-accepting chemotaxis protein-1 (serine sensor receptor)